MKKLITATLLTGTLLSPVMAFAQATSTGGITGIAVPATINIPGIVNRIINWSFGFIIVVGAAVILFGAFLTITSGGDAEKAATAKGYIIYTCIALVVAFIARGLLAIAAYLLKG